MNMNKVLAICWLINICSFLAASIATNPNDMAASVNAGYDGSTTAPGWGSTTNSTTSQMGASASECVGNGTTTGDCLKQTPSLAQTILSPFEAAANTLVILAKILAWLGSAVISINMYTLLAPTLLGNVLPMKILATMTTMILAFCNFMVVASIVNAIRGAGTIGK